MMGAVFESFSPPSINRAEIYRYLRSHYDEDIDALIDSVIEEATELTYLVSYVITDVAFDGERVIFGKVEVESEDLRRCLSGCKKAVIFAATIGTSIDRLIGKYSRLKPSRALVFQAYGAERIEALCDMLCDQLGSELNMKVGPRFSAGYGDLSLEFQRDVFDLLSCGRIGLTLNESLSMSPSKSVTAIAGLK